MPAMSRARRVIMLTLSKGGGGVPPGSVALRGFNAAGSSIQLYGFSSAGNPVRLLGKASS